MVSSLLEPVPLAPGENANSNEGHDDEFWLSEDEECYLKVDFPDSTYTISWPSELSATEFTSLLQNGLIHSPEKERVTILSDDQTYRGIPLKDFGEEIPYPDSPGLVKYSADVESIVVEIEWVNYPTHPRISINSAHPEIAENFSPFFEQTVFSGSVDHVRLENAYAEAVEQIKNRIEQ